MKNEKIKQQLETLPNLPGSYQYYDKNNEVIYVGKAKNLKKRVSSYFIKNDKSIKLQVLVAQIEKIEFIITNNEVEALILESHLIKKYKPKYNVLLKDDKKFPYFVVTKEEYPRIIVARKGNKNAIEGKYFGPYTDSRAMYGTLDLIKRIFPLKQCKTPKFSSRPCMYYSIGRCCAPCQRLVSPEDYQKILNKAQMFLQGKQGDLLKQLEKEMQKFSDNLQFEKAARCRDAIYDIKKTMENQRVVFENTKINRDIVGCVIEYDFASICLLQIRTGRLIAKRDFKFEINSLKTTEEEIFEAFLREYYELLSNIELPDEIVLSTNLTSESSKIYEQWLSFKANKRVKIIKGTSKQYQELKNLAIKNAVSNCEKIKMENLNSIQMNFNDIGSYIQEKLELSSFPHVVECFDISHIQGTNTVASMVVFENGMKKKSKYRKFKIKTVENKPDDFLSMKEVVSRRYGRLLKENAKFPDLIIIDGGKGQLSSAIEFFNSHGISDVNIVSLAKREEEIFIPGRNEPVIFAKNSGALHFFQQIRDEAHRFAITFHRSLRQKKAKESILDDIKGLSEKNKIILLQNFKTIENIKKASVESMIAFVPKSCAQAVHNFFHS